MNIVFLDAFAFSDIIEQVNNISQYGNLTTYMLTPPNKVEERIKDADIIITNKVILGSNEFDKAPNLKLICVSATGTNNIDITEAQKRGIEVMNVKDYSTESVAQHTISLILALAGSLINYNNESKSGKWPEHNFFCMLNHPFFELKGKKLGVIGYGAIGKRVAELAKAFGMEVLIAKRKGVTYKDNINRMDFNTLLKESDIITIHTPLTEQTYNMFSMQEFKLMKKNAFLINVSRGGIVNENDLYTALKSNIIKASALDVVEKEPIIKNHPLLELNNIIITPHVAWISIESRKRLIDGVIENIKQKKTLS